ncbi:MAG: hypothetical protein LBU55_05550 [Elusimicrobiota bacterium]|jgi:hypothetical protein|nr:hypothetical protein [Elusimicrobiota bacterium]
MAKQSSVFFSLLLSLIYFNSFSWSQVQSQIQSTSVGDNNEIKLEVPSQLTEHYADIGADFSIRYPKKCIIKKFKGLPFKTIIAPIEEAFYPNGNFLEDTNKKNIDTTLGEYVSATIKNLKNKYVGRDFKILNKSKFKTHEGLNGLRVSVTMQQNHNLLKQTFYFFSVEKKKKIVVAFTCLAKSGKKYEVAVDSCVKTLKIFNEER